MERIIFCHGKQKTLVGKTLVRVEQTEVENVSATWEKIMDKGYVRMRTYVRGNQQSMKEKSLYEEKSYIDKDSGSR